jgi:hypothetical protein
MNITTNIDVTAMKAVMKPTTTLTSNSMALAQMMMAN